jgi:diaminopimelate epimerase
VGVLHKQHRSYRDVGLGADGVIRLAPPAGDGDDVFMDYRNADGSVAEMCGNGVRCVAKFLIDRGLVDDDVVRVGTVGGTRTVEVAERDADGKVVRVRVDMGVPEPRDLHRTLDLSQGPVEVTTLAMPNPHAVLEVDDVDAAPVAELGPQIERHPAFPNATNVEFISVHERDRVTGRIWERGVGETLASGTGAAAMAVAAHLRGLADRHVTVVLPGGELAVEWAEDTLYVTGPAVEVAVGELDDAWLAAT